MSSPSSEPMKVVIHARGDVLPAKDPVGNRLARERRKKRQFFEKVAEFNKVHVPLHALKRLGLEATYIETEFDFKDKKVGSRQIVNGGEGAALRGIHELERFIDDGFAEPRFQKLLNLPVGGVVLGTHGRREARRHAERLLKRRRGERRAAEGRVASGEAARRTPGNGERGGGARSGLARRGGGAGAALGEALQVLALVSVLRRGTHRSSSRQRLRGVRRERVHAS